MYVQIIKVEHEDDKKLLGKIGTIQDYILNWDTFRPVAIVDVDNEQMGFFLDQIEIKENKIEPLI